ncbi:MAG: hypothetical protein QOH56_4350 [Pseudonocardiales bacterium]|jgi:hypothetical protein|nr:hypothetical protein [Pseudonocardiales bacterium]
MTDEHRTDDYENHTPPVVTEAGIARPSETEEFRSHDHDELHASRVIQTIQDGAYVEVKSIDDAETKVVTPESKTVETK